MYRFNAYLQVAQPVLTFDLLPTNLKAGAFLAAFGIASVILYGAQSVFGIGISAGKHLLLQLCRHWISAYRFGSNPSIIKWCGAATFYQSILGGANQTGYWAWLLTPSRWARAEISPYIPPFTTKFLPCRSPSINLSLLDSYLNVVGFLFRRPCKTHLVVGYLFDFVDFEKLKRRSCWGKAISS